MNPDEVNALDRYNRGLITLSELARQSPESIMPALVAEIARFEELYREIEGRVAELEKRTDWVTDLLYDADLVPYEGQ